MDYFILKLKQFFGIVYNNKEIPKDETETETELPESKTIIEEKERYIKEILSLKLCMENNLDRMVARLKPILEYQHELLFEADNLVFIYVLSWKRLRFLTTHPERNIKNILKASDGHELFKWREECRKGMPIDYNFMISKGTLSNFKGSKGCIGELSVVNGVSEDYDVIRFKAEPIQNSGPDEDGKDEVYLHARWFKLTELKYRFLVYLTLATLHTLNLMIGFELGIWGQDENIEFCVDVLSYLCQVNEMRYGLISISYEVLFISWHEVLTISEYRTAVKELGYSRFKPGLDAWSNYSFDVMRWTVKIAKLYDVWYIELLAPFGMMYKKYLQWIKRGRAPKDWTFFPIICRLSKMMNRTAGDYHEKFHTPEVIVI